jgi:hypothetical protein
MTTAETWADEYSQSGPFDRVDNMRDLVEIIREIQRDAAEPSFGNIGPECPSCGRDNSEYGCVCTSDDCPAHGRETLAIGVLARFASYVDAVEAALLQTEVGRNAYPQYAANLSAAGTALKDVCIRAGRSLSGAEKAPCESPSLDSLLRELHGAVEDLVRHSVVTTAPVWQRLMAARNAVNNYKGPT